MFTCTEGEAHNGVHISESLVKTDGMFSGAGLSRTPRVSLPDTTRACDVSLAYINLTCFLGVGNSPPPLYKPCIVPGLHHRHGLNHRAR